MARTNVAVKADPIFTHEGARAVRVNAEQQLRRLTLATMLFEDQFYVDGVEIAEAIREAAKKVPDEKVADLARECRTNQKLRHMPLFLVRDLARRRGVKPGLVRDALADVIQRADELAEFLALYWKDQKGKKTLSAQVKKGLAKAFQKFDAYKLAKYNRDDAVKLRDVLFLCHAKPKDEAQAALWKSLIDGTLQSADTWETRLSAGEGKKTVEEKQEKWAGMLKDEKLGALALLRNLRNMIDAKVPMEDIRAALANIKVERVLPFRFIAAARHAPKLEPELEVAMLKCLSSQEKLPGKTVLIIDVSGSMSGMISSKSELTRYDAAAAVAMLLREVCDDVSIYLTAGNDGRRVHKTALIPSRRGFALRDAVHKGYNELGGGGIFLVQCMQYTYEKEREADRVIVITDEQDCDIDPAKAPEKAITYGGINYLINIAAYQNGIGYGKWTHIDGWSEAVIDFIREYEKAEAAQ
jgi:60 kDa SS-A/Ro ribonucleoprotein